MICGSSKFTPNKNAYELLSLYWSQLKWKRQMLNCWFCSGLNWNERDKWTYIYSTSGVWTVPSRSDAASPCAYRSLCIALVWKQKVKKCLIAVHYRRLVSHQHGLKFHIENMNSCSLHYWHAINSLLSLNLGMVTSSQFLHQTEFPNFHWSDLFEFISQRFTIPWFHNFPFLITLPSKFVDTEAQKGCIVVWLMFPIHTKRHDKGTSPLSPRLNTNIKVPLHWAMTNDKAKLFPNGLSENSTFYLYSE